MACLFSPSLESAVKLPQPRMNFPLIFCAALLSFTPAEAQEPTPKQIQFFESQVRPVLADNCFRCHGRDKQKGHLRLDSFAAITKGGTTGPAVVPGKPAESLLVRAINYQDLEMPPSKKLAKKDIDTLTTWIKMGAPWPGGQAAAVKTGPAEAFHVTDADRKYWAFQPVRRPKVPTVGYQVSPIDAFLLEKLRGRNLAFSALAGRREMIRRAYFDLIGLPPPPDEVDRFVADAAPDSYEKLIDRLLVMPQYGERWGRHWLDVVRFAQTSGYERDDEKLFAWRYRDYVIKSLNDDKPYDQFVREQLAGDELDHVTDDARIATGFFRLGVWDDEPDDARQAEFDDLDDMLSTTASAFLGITLGCARCHDHKFDPIGQQDYYGMLAFLRNIQPHTKPGKGDDKTIFTKLSTGENALVVHERGPAPPKTHILIRGSAATPGAEVEPRFVQVLCPPGEAARPRIPAAAKDAATSGRRRVLADWIARPDNPLTARVLVNRLWQHHFGRDIVASPNDFGKTGTPPTHPELLDWLAAELVDGGWKIKRIHKLILLSNAYRQSSRIQNDAAVAVDPDNSLLWRQNLRRLEAEALRDTMLAISGQLNLKMGGRGFFPALSKEVLSTQSVPGRGWDQSSKEEQRRRSVYIFVKRTLGVPLLETFDVASPDTSTAARNTTTIAPQALMLLNSAFIEEQAAACADRLMKEVTGSAPEAQVTRLFRLALARPPSADEMKIALNYLGRVRPADNSPAGQRRALARLCKVVMNLNEVVYVD
jgi:hypothetical protein